jgi:hypothetical protein
MSGSSMASRGDTIENPLTGERMTFLETARDTDGELLQMEYVAPHAPRGRPSTSTRAKRSATRWCRAR